VVTAAFAAFLLMGPACNDAHPANARTTSPAGKRAPAKREAVRPEAGPRVLLDGRDEQVAVRVEIARDPATRARGLMFRRQMDPDAGMIFLFERSEVQDFWMKNTYLPLDMIFIGADLRVVGVVEDAEPLTETTRTVGQPSQYVLETNAGFARRHGIGPGARVVFEGIGEGERE